MIQVLSTKIGIRVLLFAVLACLGAPGTTLGEASSNANLERAADEAYERILTIFKEVPPGKCDPVLDEDDTVCNYWQLGHAFDTALDYIRRNPKKAKVFAREVIEKYDITSKTPWACWYDDFGWWAVAAQRAIGPEHRALWSRGQRHRLEEIAAETWARMQSGLFVWDHQQEQFNDPGFSQEPRFDGGIWNYFWTKEALPNACNTPCDPTDFLENNLCGRQNTVTNGLYLVAAAIRAKHSGDMYFLQAARREQVFLNQWFDPANFSRDPRLSLLFPLDTSNPDTGPAVIRERVSTFADLNYDHHFEYYRIWAGDQGLILGGLLRLIDADQSNPDREALLDLAKRITDGVLIYLVAQTDEPRFFPWSNTSNPTPDTIGDAPGFDTNDYNTGIGVYMRYLLYAYRTNKEMRQHLKDTKYPELVRKFAEDFAAKDRGLCYHDEETDCVDLVRSTNKLAAIMAALTMTQDKFGSTGGR